MEVSCHTQVQLVLLRYSLGLAPAATRGQNASDRAAPRPALCAASCCTASQPQCTAPVHYLLQLDLTCR